VLETIHEEDAHDLAARGRRTRARTDHADVLLTDVLEWVFHVLALISRELDAANLLHALAAISFPGYLSFSVRSELLFHVLPIMPCSLHLEFAPRPNALTD
jgi:hypothetical protein